MTSHAFPPGSARGACRRCGLRFAILDRGKAASPRFVVQYTRNAHGGRPRVNSGDLSAFPCKP